MNQFGNNWLLLRTKILEIWKVFASTFQVHEWKPAQRLAWDDIEWHGGLEGSEMVRMEGVNLNKRFICIMNFR